MKSQVTVSAAVEGIVDEAVVRKLIIESGGTPGTIYGKNGKSFLRRQIHGYNNAARHFPWIVLVDMDSDAECPPPLRDEWLPDPAPYLCFRIAVREVEAWLMADTDSLSSFLGVPRSKIPSNPEQLSEPKREMVTLARKSRRKAIREDMIPREGSGRAEGPAYSSRMIEFVHTSWRPEAAMKHAESLRRAMTCFRRLVSDAPD